MATILTRQAFVRSQADALRDSDERSRNAFQCSQSMEEFIAIIFKVLERMGATRQSRTSMNSDLARFTCSDEEFLGALRAELGVFGTVSAASWPHRDKWAAFTYSPQPIIFEFTQAGEAKENVRGIRIVA
jgi:hypothetical protein